MKSWRLAELTPGRIAALYAIIGGLWILFSDEVLFMLARDAESLARWQTYKGWSYVAVTAAILFFLVRTYAVGMSASRERYFRLFDVSPDALFILDADGKIIDANKVAEMRYGFDRHDLLKMSVRDLAVPDLQGQVAERIGKALASRVQFEWQHRRSDGSEFPVEVAAQPITLHGRRCILSSVRDITVRKRLEEIVLARDKQLTLFVEYSPAAIAMLDKDMKYIIASRRWYSDYDLGEKDIIGRSHYEVFPDIPARWREVHRRCLAGAVERSEEDPFVREDGTTDWVRWEIRPWYHGTDEIGGIIIFSEVITERKRAEEELRVTNEELLAVNRIISVSTSTTTGVQSVLESVLDEALSISGLEGGTICLVTPDNTLELVTHRGTSEATIQDLTTNVVRVGECLCGECARDHKPLILRDREAVLKYSTREAARGEDIRFHAAFPLVTGDECLGVLCVFTRTEKKPADRRLKLLGTVSAQIALAVQNAQLYEETVHHSATLENTVRERTSELEESQQALINIVEDLNEKTAELGAANEKLKELDRLKSMFIASMSHELRTPLNSVIGFSSVLLNEWAGRINDEQKSLLSTISRSGKHLLALINDVIDVSKIEAGTLDVHIEEFDLYDLIAEIAALMKKEIDEKHLELSIDAIHLIMHTDRRRLFQSVLNLVSNAVKFTPQGSVRICAGRIRKSELGIQSGTTAESPLSEGDEDFVEISVEDTGIGIKKEDIPLLFKSFVRLDSPLRSTVLGTGLGLYLSKKLVTEILKGDIVVESRYEAGSRFAIIVPVNIEAAAEGETHRMKSGTP